jgi:hypothetical protein
MNIVLETAYLQSALKEKRDWARMGYSPVRVTDKHKVFDGHYQHVYRVWVGSKKKR